MMDRLIRVSRTAPTICVCDGSGEGTRRKCYSARTLILTVQLTTTATFEVTFRMQLVSGSSEGNSENLKNNVVKVTLALPKCSEKICGGLEVGDGLLLAGRARLAVTVRVTRLLSGACGGRIYRSCEIFLSRVLVLDALVVYVNRCWGCRAKEYLH